MTQKRPRRVAPAHLAPPTAAWWREVVREYDLEAHHERLLTLAAEAWDRGQEARVLLATEGIVDLDRFGQKRQHPAVAIERDSRLAFARLIRELGLDVEPPRETPRPRPLAIDAAR